ncbi:VOC family protein [Flavobacterium sp. SUN052]|uniref:VOC family protein n=1 Tax=Flavobacterium sp. SUN052 TaxID=3002441 RepID=UPI00237DDA8B|nr:VOC family protein [Flavobacterium sp. SUN052]MEC4005205.1 VOC family protein [Flavobacterium sp. SUN052]
MAQVNPYLIFNGNCEAAFNLYKSVFGGEFPYIGRFGEMPPTEGQPELPENEKDRIMHVSLPIGGTILMGSDTNSQAGDVKVGDNVSISINAETRAEADKLFNGLSNDGEIKMPMQDTFWGAYFGMFIDKFGIHWMINFDEVPN